MKHLPLFLVLCFSLAACSLEEEALDEANSDGLLVGEDAALHITAPAYAMLIITSSWLRRTVWGLNELTSDELIIPCRTRGDWCDRGLYIQLHQHSWTPSHEEIFECWRFLEEGIGRTNTALNLLREQKKNNSTVEAELQFLRAYFRYWELDFFRQVSFRSEEDQDFLSPPPVLAAAEAFQWLEGELLQLIPDLKDLDETGAGRVNRQAAYMLLAKLYLNAEVYTGTAHWEEALDACGEIINSGYFTLTEDYFSLFGVNNHIDNPEAILTVPQTEYSNLRMFSGPAFTLHYNQHMGRGFGGFNGYCAGTSFLASWDTTDLRFRDERIRAATGANLGFLSGPQFHPDGSPIEDSERTNSSGAFVQLDYTPEISTMVNAKRHEGVRVLKYEPDLQAPDWLSIGRPDFLIFRYADVHLMKAEALFRLGQVGEAQEMINRLREARSVARLETLEAADILAERGFELYWEGYRRQDMIRFGRFTEDWEHKPPSEGFRKVFPVPQTALNINPNLVQNPGY